MPKIALDGATFVDTIAPNHIYYRIWQYQGYNDSLGNPVYAYNYYYTSATVKGTAKSTVTNVKINGSSPIVQGDRTIENDTYSLPSGGEYISGSHSSAQGSVTVGNNRNVYANGKLIAVSGSTVTTHAGTSSTINGRLSTNVNIGG